MIITSAVFLFFTFAVVAAYHLMPLKFRKYWLLAVSYVFYISWAWEFAIILLALTAANYFIALELEKNKPGRTRLLWLGIAANLTALLFFRAANFFVPDFVELFQRLGITAPFQSLNILLPIGMAFYALQNISYIVDVYRKQVAASTSFAQFALYLAYFPKLLSGPIERARTFLPAIDQPRLVDNQTAARGITLILIGLMRKLFVAGLLSGIIFWDAFETPEKYTGFELIAWIAIYGLYLYNDFAGYTGIARGISALFGIELSPNFKQPFLARSMSEFWNSWHISLSHWLRDYIYFPASRFLLSRNRNPRNLVNLILPPLLTMLVSGLWHGLSWNMLLWGGLHGIYLAGERLLALRGPAVQPGQLPLWRQLISGSTVFFLVTVTWVPFIMEPSVALNYWRGMFDWTHPVIRFRRILISIPVFALILALDWLERHYQDEVILLRLPRWSQSFLLAACLFVLMFLLQSEQQDPFVYQGF
jgi:alginate O-acetyltransferase complex protein AlgI